MQLSKKLKIFFQLFSVFLKSTFNFEQVEQKDEFHWLCLSETIDCEIRATCFSTP